MQLGTYVDRLGQELVALLETGGDDVRELVERLTGGLGSAIRLTLLETLSAAADEITQDLAPGSVEVRLRGREPEFVVAVPPAEQPAEEPAEERPPAVAPDPLAEDGATARINVRLPEQLKVAVEEAAAKEGRSVNAWLVRAAAAGLRPPPQDTAARPIGGRRGSQRVTGWVR